jgi:DNA-binding response OmpR family regulator
VVGGARIHLTRVQFDLLTFLYRHRSRVISHREIAKDVLGTEGGDVDLLARVHICNLRRALGAAGAIATIRGRGYQLNLSVVLRTAT